MNGPTILAVGRVERSEFRRMSSLVGSEGRMRMAPNLRAALGVVERGWRPELVVLFQSRPGQFGEASIMRLRQAAPTARWLVVAGSWCEGEVRSGRPPGAIARWYWHQGPARWLRGETARRRGKSAGWMLPATATDEERLLADMVVADGGVSAAGCLHPGPLPEGEEDREGLRPAHLLERATVGIAGQDAEMRQVLARAMAQAGATIVETFDRGTQAIVWDGRTPAEFGEVVALRRQAPGAAIVAVVGFPRWEDVRALRRAGAAAVLSKPVLIGELIWAVRRTLRGRRPASRSRAGSRRRPQAQARSG